MASRATYAVRRDDGTKLYYSHWGGQHIEDDLLWGPEVALAFIESLDSGSETDLFLDAAWCEGGAVVDLIKKKLLVFGGEVIGADPEMRNIWLHLVALGWSGWSIAWAYHGMADIADAIGVPRERVLGKLTFEKFDADKLYNCHTAGRARMFLSIKENDGIFRHFGFDAPLEYYLFAGTRLIEALQKCKSYSVASMEHGKDLPQDALHINQPDKKLVVTLAPVFGNFDPRLQQMIEDAWPGWTVKLNYEGLRKHPRAARLDFSIAQPSLDEMLGTLRDAVCRPFAFDPASSVQPEFIESNLQPYRTFYNHKVAPLSTSERTARFEQLASDFKVAWQS